MGEFGLQILGDCDRDVAKDGIGDDAESAVEALFETLGTLGFRSLRGAVLAPGAAHPDILEPTGPAAAPVAQLPIDPAAIAAGDAEAGPWKCPECGLTYANPGSCVGGEYGHAAATLQPAEAVHAAADPDGAKAAAVAEAAPAARPSVLSSTAEPIAWGDPGQPDRRVGATDRRVEQIEKPAGATDKRVGPADRRNADAAVERSAPSWPTS